MPLVFLGVAFVVALFIYYILSTSNQPKNDTHPHVEDDDIREEENVIYLSDDIDKIKKNHGIGD